MPIRMATSVTVRTVTFWYPARHLGITNWRVALAGLFDDELRPVRRMIAAPHAGEARGLLAAPGEGQPTRCAGGPVYLLDLAGTGAQAAEEAGARHDAWSATGRVCGRRPGRVETELLEAGRADYVTYHSQRRVVGDALIIMRTGGWLHPTGSGPQALIDHVRLAVSTLSEAAPDDVLVTVAV